MKRPDVILLFLLATVSGSAQGLHKRLFVGEPANYTAYYKHTWAADSANSGAKSSELMRLDLGSKTSCFESVGTHLTDSVNAAFQNQTVDNATLNLYASTRGNLPGSANRYRVYKNVSAGALVFCEKLSRKEYAYLDSFPANTWLLTAEVKRIGKHFCQQAFVSFRGRSYEAWFTRELPVSEGPYKFYGLPGLIVSLQDTRSHYAFELVSFGTSRAGNRIELPKEVILANRAAMIKGKRDYHENLVNMVDSLPNQVPLTPAERAAERRRVQQKFNNSLELR